MNEVIAELELTLKAKITHTAEADNVDIRLECFGNTSPEGWRKLILDCIERLVVEYKKNRKDLWLSGERRRDLNDRKAV